MDSYSLGTEYGTDQINSNSSVFPDFLRRDNYNDFHQINKIKDREIRLYEKIKAYNINKNKECFNHHTEMSLRSTEGRYAVKKDRL